MRLSRFCQGEPQHRPEARTGGFRPGSRTGGRGRLSFLTRRPLCFAGLAPPRPPLSISYRLSMAAGEAKPKAKKLRLGGMALRNGLLVHGPTHWAAAVRRPDGS